MKLPRWLVPIIVGVVTFIAFLPTLQNGFVNLDDPILITENPHYRGLGPDQLEWMFTNFLLGHYQPLTWLTYGVDYLIWGMDPTGYHLTSLLFHVASAVLLYFLLLGLLRRVGLAEATLYGAAALGALFFAVHPLRVESVVWVTERRDVVAGLFFMLTLLAYLRMVQERDRGGTWRRWLAVSASLFACSLLSKALGIMLPLVLMIIDAYPLRRWTPGLRRQVLLEKIPFFLLAMVDGLVMLSAMREGAEGVRSLEGYDPAARIMQSAYGLCFYPWKTIFPFHLSPLYPIQRGMSPWEICALVAVLAVTMLALIRRTSWPALAAAWFSYGLLVFPVLGVVLAGHQVAADRYTYLSCLPWAAMVAWLFSCASLHRPAPWLALGAVVVAFLGVRTWQQTRHWKDSMTLWSHAVSIPPVGALAYSNYGHALNEAGDSERALEAYGQAVAAHPGWYSPYFNRGLLRYVKGDTSGAAADFDVLLRLRPVHREGRFYRGLIRQGQGNLPGAWEDYTAAIQADPNFATAYTNRGNVRRMQGDLEGAIRDYTESIRSDSRMIGAYVGRGGVLLEKGEVDRAIKDFDAALQREPHHPTALLNRGVARGQKGDKAGAEADLLQALEHGPPDWPYRPAARQLLEKLREGP